jgi:predicted O-methyltransferase YrrM
VPKARNLPELATAAEEPLPLSELARPMQQDFLEADAEALEAGLPNDIEPQHNRLDKLRRELTECETALANLRLKLGFFDLAAKVLSVLDVLILNFVRRWQLVKQMKQTDDLVRYIADVEGLTRLVAGYEVTMIDLQRKIEESAQIVAMEHDLFDGHPLTKLARSFWRDPWWPELQSIRRISMLHPETLYILRCCAARMKNAVVEVGPYIGGSTIALGRGLQLGGAGPMVSVEIGGSHPTKSVPTNDIITDLKRNVEAYGLAGVVHIMEGFTTDPKIDEAVNRILAGRPIDLLCLDADGNVERDFEFYRGRLNRGAILVFDDYLYFDPVIGAPEKQTMVKAWVDACVASGLVENLGVYRWGTWVGRYWG